MESKTNNALKLKAAGVFAVAASTLSVPTVAFAEESSGGISAILPDMMEFIPMLVAFIILWIILAKFGWPAFDKMLQKRKDTIEDSLTKSEAARVESERVLAEYQKELADAKKQASEIVADAKRTAEAAKADINAQAQKESEAMIVKARAAIEAEKKHAIAELQSSVADTSISVASKIIGSDLSDEEHRKLVERYVNEAGSFNAN